MTREQMTTGRTAATGEADQALDEAFDRMAASDFELPSGFVNHGPMACEALAALGCDAAIDGWARWFADMVPEGPVPLAPTSPAGFDWQDALGVYGRLPEWLGYFNRSIGDDGWETVVATWVPRLMPGLATVLFHGAIRTAHAVRAVGQVDSPSRQAELARSLGYWAARFRVGQPPSDLVPVDEIARSTCETAADGAGYYVASPNIFNLHAVTGAMAVALLVGHVAADAGFAALAQLRAEHSAMFAGTDPAGAGDTTSGWDALLAGKAASSRDAHQVKLVEACRRGFAVTGDPILLAAADQVSGRRHP
jgi:hypothetical protein